MDRIPLPPAILIVDDDSDILALLNLFMHRLAPTYDIITVRDAQSALSHLTHRAVPLVITDYMMPGMDGLQLTAAVKAASPTTHVILATGYSSAEIEQVFSMAFAPPRIMAPYTVRALASDILTV